MHAADEQSWQLSPYSALHEAHCPLDSANQLTLHEVHAVALHWLHRLPYTEEQDWQRPSRTM